MKKKNILSLFLAGAAMIFTMPSCMNLDETVYDKLPADDFGNTEVEINALIGTVHNTLKKYWPGDFRALSENAGSMAVTPTRKGGDWYDGGQYREIYMHTWTANTTAIKNAWSTASSAIGTCNATIEVLKNSEILSEADKTMKVAEVRGIRAFWIYVMMDNWGNIPLVTDYNDKELPSCKSRQEVFDWLLTEVQEISTQCPDASAETYGQFTKGAANTLLAKLYLNADAWGVTTSGNNYQQVIENCDKVMATEYYILEPVWKDNFSITNNNSREAILACSFSSSDTEDQNQMMNQTLHYKDNLSLGGSFSAWNGVSAQPEYVRLFPEDDPRLGWTFLIGQQYDKNTGEALVTDHGFPLNHTIDIEMLPGTEYDGTTWGAVNQHDGARCLKWDYADDLVDAMENDFHIFRLADVYLMKAEALLRSGGSVSEATQLVNAIRERAYGDSSHNYESVDLDKVQLERRLELAWENFSRQDDIRFGCFDQGMWPASNCTRATGDHLKIYPVSQDAWQTNPNLTQNPGYAAF